MVETTAFIVLGIWGLVVIGCLVAASTSERKQWQAERKDLLNRIMSRDYNEFAKAEQQADTPAMKVIPLEDLRRELEEDRRESLGMPV